MNRNMNFITKHIIHCARFLCLADEVHCLAEAERGSRIIGVSARGAAEWDRGVHASPGGNVWIESEPWTVLWVEAGEEIKNGDVLTAGNGGVAMRHGDSCIRALDDAKKGDIFRFRFEVNYS